MELRSQGKADGPAVLLLPAGELDADALLAGMGRLEKSFRLLIPSPDMDAPTLENLLLHQGLDGLWGAWGLRSGASLLLELLARGRISVRTAVLEGAFALPSAPMNGYEGRLICWKGGKDKAARKAWEALKAQTPALRSVTLGKLKKNQDFFSVRPDLMVKRLSQAFGSVRQIRGEQVLKGTPERVWNLLRRSPVSDFERERLALAPLKISEAQRTLRAEGRSGTFPVWVHTVRVEERGADRTACLDQLELDAGKLTLLAAPLSKLWLRREQRRRSRRMKKDGQRGF